MPIAVGHAARGSWRASVGSNVSLPAGTGRVGGEDGGGDHLLARRRGAQAPVRDQGAHALQREERRVALVHVEDGRRHPGRGEGADAADAEQDLLADAQLAVAAVERAGDRADVLGVLPGMSASSRSSGTRPTWMRRTAARTRSVAHLHLDHHRRAVGSVWSESGRSDQSVAG